MGLLSVREPSHAARLPRILLRLVNGKRFTGYEHHASISCDGRKGEGDYQGATSHAADRFSSAWTGRSALRVVAPWALYPQSRSFLCNLQFTFLPEAAVAL